MKSLGIKSTIRFLAGMYLLLNLCVSTIPRCDSILKLMQHTLNMTSSLTHPHASTGPACHESAPALKTTRISQDKVCECSLVKFVFVTLPSFDPRQYIGFHIQSTTLLSFDIPLWNPAAKKGPEPPYPRISLA